jgi:PKD repeat protein
LDYESFFWDFGDGQQSLLQNPKHFYNAYGTYEAKLYVVGYGGCLDSISKQINVFNPYTTPFSYTPLDACNQLNVDFSIGPPADTKWTLYFGDNEIDSSQRTNLSHLYKSPSFYSPYLLLTDHPGLPGNIGWTGCR